MENNIWLAFENPQTGYIHIALAGNDSHFSFEDIGFVEKLQGSYEECNDIRNKFYEDCIRFYDKESKSFIMFSDEKLQLINSVDFLKNKLCL